MSTPDTISLDGLNKAEVLAAPIRDRFADCYRVEASGCWVWQRAKSAAGYGVLRDAEGNLAYAHRVSYQRNRGAIPRGTELDHLCRNRACVNPAHLEAVPHRENNVRGLRHNQNTGKTHCLRGHPLDSRNSYMDKRGRRSCRPCAAARQSARRAK